MILFLAEQDLPFSAQFTYVEQINFFFSTQKHPYSTCDVDSYVQHCSLKSQYNYAIII